MRIHNRGKLRQYEFNRKQVKILQYEKELVHTLKSIASLKEELETLKYTKGYTPTTRKWNMYNHKKNRCLFLVKKLSNMK